VVIILVLAVINDRITKKMRPKLEPLFHALLVSTPDLLLRESTAGDMEDLVIIPEGLYPLETKDGHQYVIKGTNLIFSREQVEQSHRSVRLIFKP
jgi:hypothetical protein